MLYLMFSIIMSTVLYMIPLLTFLPFKLTIKQKAGLFLLFFINICLIALVTGNQGIICLLLTISGYLALIDEHRIRNICIFIISYMVNVIWDNLTGTLIWILFHITAKEVMTIQIVDSLYLLFCIISVYFVSKGLLFLFWKFSHRLQLSTLPPKIICTLIINLLLTLTLFIVNIVAGERIGYPPMVIYFNTFLFSVYFLASAWNIVQSIHTYQKETDLQIKQNSFQAMQSYTSQVETLYNNLRSFKHDYANILATLYAYIEKGNMKELEIYFRKEILPLSDSLSPHNYQITRLANLKITALKSLVTSKIIYAQEKGIHITIEIADIIEAVSLDMIDLTRIIGIFLDNAIEAALETNQPKLSFISLANERETVFIIKNSFQEHHLKINSLSSPSVSSKGPDRGIGLYNVAQILSKYQNVYLDTQTQGTVFTQTLHIYEI